MAELSQIKGALLEEVILVLLKLIGYRVIDDKSGEEGTRKRGAGLEVQGRGAWHQIDAFAAFEQVPPFIYPIRLILEAKCYHPPVGIEIIRNFVGVLKDINENYFSFRPFKQQKAIQLPRYNYVASVFSSSGFTEPAQSYALAQQIYLIQYKNIKLLKPIIKSLNDLKEDDFRTIKKLKLNNIRHKFRDFLNSSDFPEIKTKIYGFRKSGLTKVHSIKLNLGEIKGSYFGMIQGRWPVHLISKRELPLGAFAENDEVLCKIWGAESNVWSFVPSNIPEDSEAWFRLEFDLPEAIVNFIDELRNKAAREKKKKIYFRVKKKFISYIDLSGRIGGVQRQVRLTLDEEWLNGYLSKKMRK